MTAAPERKSLFGAGYRMMLGVSVRAVPWLYGAGPFHIATSVGGGGFGWAGAVASTEMSVDAGGLAWVRIPALRKNEDASRKV
jgi:hypothetical protein